MITIIITAVSSALIYFLGWLIYEYISYRKLLKQESKVRQHLQDYPLADYSDLGDSEDYDDLGDSEDYDGLDVLLDEDDFESLFLGFYQGTIRKEKRQNFMVLSDHDYVFDQKATWASCYFMEYEVSIPEGDPEEIERTFCKVIDVLVEKTPKVYANILEEAMIQDIENDNLEDEYYHHDEDYYRTHSTFVIIEKDENESMNQ